MTRYPLPPDPADFGSLAELAPALARMVASVASDIALVIDEQGVIRDVAEGPATVSAQAIAWVGRRFEDIASSDSRNKVKLLLDEALSKGVTRRREINHPSDAGASVPVAWTAVRLGQTGPVVAVGRDLRAVSAIQQRMVDAQQDLERDYWRRRQVEQRYRQLFRVANDAVLVLDAESLKLLDCNELAAELFGATAADAGPAPWPDTLPGPARAAVIELLLAARSSDRAAEIRVRAGVGELPLEISATPLRINQQPELLVRARRHGLEDDHAAAGSLARQVDEAGDAVVITDSSGRIQMANVTFTRLVAHGDDAALRGRLLGALVGDDSGAWMALLALALQDGISPARPLELLVGGLRQPVRVQASLLTDGEQLAVGFTLRLEGTASAAGRQDSAGTRAPGHAGAPHTERAALRAAAHLGQAPLGELLARAVAEIERDLIELALERCAGRLVAATVLLGLPEDELRRRMQALGMASAAGAASGSGPHGPTH
jgi:transcriptional regulator PpsR